METDVYGIPGPIFFDPDAFNDARGSFREIFHEDRYAEWLPKDIEWKQINHSHSFHNTIRGLHYRHDEAKLITVIDGAIIDVVVDIRRDSRTFGNWMSIALIAGQQLFIPEGFAHGFEVISDANVVYMTNQMYDKDKCGAIAWDDPDLAIKWQNKEPILSEHDKSNPSFAEYLNG